MAVKDYNVDPDLNTTIEGINIAEGCPPSGINNAIRQLMADVKEESEAKAEKDTEQDAAIESLESSKVSTVNGLTPDSNGNVDVGGMPLGTAIPYTGKDVPAGTLRADGTTYTGMQASFPEFYEWVVNSGLTVPLADYALVEGSCGFYGLDASTGTVRMPTLAAGVFGADAASKYGQAVEAGLPGITGGARVRGFSNDGNHCVQNFSGALYEKSRQVSDLMADGVAGGTVLSMGLDASRSSAVYGKSDTVTPAHVKYPWVIVVYNAAVAPSVAQAGEFIEMLDKLATALPTGTVVPHAGNKDLNGYLLCNGAAVSRTTYAKLFEAIGTTYGAGNGSTTFNLPDLTDKFIQGSGTAGTVKAAGLPNITGSLEDLRVRIGAHEENNGTGAFRSQPKHNSADSANGAQVSQEFSFDASRSNAIYGASATVQPPALTMRYYIKY